MVREIKDLEEFHSALKEAGDKLVVVDFTASWCPPCRRISPVFSSLSEEAEFMDIVFMKVDVDLAQLDSPLRAALALVLNSSIGVGLTPFLELPKVRGGECKWGYIQYISSAESCCVDVHTGEREGLCNALAGCGGEYLYCGLYLSTLQQFGVSSLVGVPEQSPGKGFTRGFHSSAGGDFNAHVGNDGDTWRGVIGRNG